MKSLKGSFLVASRSLADPNFQQTVLLLFEHHLQGAAGVVLNRPTGATIAEVSGKLFDEHEDWEKPIYLGGPVPGPLIALHTNEELSDELILPGVYSTIDPEKLRELIRDRFEPSILVANYAGWGPGQLESELEEDSWLVSPADSDRLFQSDTTELWRETIRTITDDHLSDLLGLDHRPEDPNLN